ncbi:MULTISPECIES: DUF4097 family beta strand repeat-containing protein [unclassified Streptomyces]|uniref:DUF4097 family beta strand repeat-containing protein n=1 Tax=unclassified Streptomyces TaxID=2593676 RepID=UPI0006FCC1EC|nr:MULTISPECIES: DUF4097 family beta strand repeat-containing protein [unclassified Streptomyces]KQX53126.1 hypothetical protein ASD33_07890 [Streptomyces sp. Root1304]KRA90047.1 hypothetical protein ASE09_07895 [Streptomyces sp. Root66D1]
MGVVRRPFRVLFVSGGVFFSSLLLAGCGSADVDDASVERKAFAFDGAALTIDSDDSELVITPADIDDVRVERQVDGWAVMGSGPKPTWTLSDGRLTLRVGCTGIASDCDAVHRVQVPRDVAVTVQDDNGGVTAEGFTTPLKVRSDNGDVRVRKPGGPVDLLSDNGDVVVDGGATSSEVVARSDNGSLRVTLGAVPRRVDLFTDNGDITLSLPTADYEVTGASDNGDVRIDVPRRDGSGHSVSARSDNGDVSVLTAN